MNVLFVKTDHLKQNLQISILCNAAFYSNMEYKITKLHTEAAVQRCS